MNEELRESTILPKEKFEKAPTVYDFQNYREFLAAFYLYKRQRNPSYTETVLLRKIGLGENTRGYLRLILNGKRNLSAKSILGFIQAFGLGEREGNYFENLVYFNQAVNERDKNFYFGRLAQQMKNRRSPAFEILKDQYDFLSHWYYEAIRELVALRDFNETPEWIRKMLRDKVKKGDIEEAISCLLRMGLLKRDEKGKLHQTETCLTFTDNSLNYTVANNLHRELLNLALDSLDQDRYEERSVSCVMLSTEMSRFEELRQEIRAFRESLLSKYGATATNPNCVLNLSIHLFSLTPLQKKEKSDVSLH